MKLSEKEKQLRSLHRDYLMECRDFKSTYLAQNGFYDQMLDLMKDSEYKSEFLTLADTGNGSVSYIYIISWYENKKIKLYVAQF